MKLQQQSQSVAVTAPSLPKGGGAIPGMGEALGHVGPTGLATMSIPLPISAGRGYAPALGLTYNSGSGNGIFGLGWNVGVMSISRRTSHGVPQYNAEDEFIGPDGEVLLPERDASGALVTTSCSQYGDVVLDATYQVTCYFPRVEGAFNRIEYWASGSSLFWLLHGADGQLHCLGKNLATRIADPADASHIAVWMLEESVSPAGEHIWYQYQQETADGIVENSVEASRDARSQLYLREVFYGNTTADASLYAWKNSAAQQPWLFSVVFDYGERGDDETVPPPYHTDTPWPLRQDPFSRYEYGFEVRTHRLCHQVLMFHHFPKELGENNTLIRRLLLDYQQAPSLSLLVGAQGLAYDEAGKCFAVPPLDLRYSNFSYTPDPVSWQKFDAMPGLDDGQHYQLVDLYGEGIPGMLYRSGQQWQYRAAIRAKSGADAVEYAPWQVLTQVPSMQPVNSRLMDITGDGRLDWLVTQPSLAGFFTLSPDASWSTFTAFSALPTEFFHPHAQLVDLMGDGLSDLVMIGPNSVRLYHNERQKFSAALEVAQDNDLPTQSNVREVVAFSDVLGSGQPHLVRIRHDGITVWPNLGYGRFATPFLLAALDFDAQSFDPSKVMLADLDGSGAADLLYLESDQIRIWFNQSGNSLAEPVSLPLPEGVRYDQLCQMNIADTQGQGMASLVLSVPYITPQHWHFEFARAKPWLLSGINNNMGGDSGLTYRSSAQEWLDEKDEDSAAVSQLPFPVQVVTQVTATDEVTGNILTKQYRYRKGVYDGQEREFRGFGYLEATDSQLETDPEGQTFAPPLLIKSWYHTGQQQDETTLFGTVYQDAQAVSLHPTFLSEFDTASQKDQVLDNPDANSLWWLYRSLKGCALRSETYGLDEDPQNTVPYSLSTCRYQVRQVRAANVEQACVAMPVALEQVSYSYERIATDPQVGQQVTLNRDQFGTSLWSVDIHYPRRPQPAQNPYPDTLPPTSWASSYDSQQQVLRISEQRSSVYHLQHPQGWRLALPNEQRQNALNQTDFPVPDGGFSYEALIDPAGPLSAIQPRTFCGQNRVLYASDPVDLLALVDHQQTAELDDVALAAYDGVIDVDALAGILGDAGYVQVARLFPTGDTPEDDIWAVEHGFTVYNTAQAFWRPKQSRETLLTGTTQYVYDPYYCMVTKVTDAQGNSVTATPDYRFLQPWQVLDINNNTQEVQFDALGNAIASSFYGTEQGTPVGFDSVTESPITAGQAVADVISNAGVTPQRVASQVAYDLFSWMGNVEHALGPDAQLSEALQQQLMSLHFITAQGYIRSHARRGIFSNEIQPETIAVVRQLLAGTPIDPVQAATLVADSYPNDAKQQVRVTVAYQDGFGRPLQSCCKVPDGDAWQRNDAGELVVDAQGNLVEVLASPRWAVSGKMEYGNKGQPVRSYQPYFLDDWQYVVDSDMRTHGYADSHYYDATGREIQVITAKNYLRRQSYYPWFMVSEDENDTLTA
jgi:hypothetical protein